MYPCGNCSTKFVYEINWKLHELLHSPAPIRCPKCEKIFSRVSSYKCHTRFHWQPEAIPCEGCKTQFHNLDDLRRHICNGNFIKGKAKNKLDGSKRFSDKGKKQEVIKKEYQCIECTKIFKKPSQLKRHFLIHTGEKPFKCEQCHKSFNQKNALETHLFKHSGYRPYTCKKCKQSFTQKGNLEVHKRRVHSLLRTVTSKYSCSICPSHFQTLGSLNSHLTKVHAIQQSHPSSNANESLTEVLQQISDLHEEHIGLTTDTFDSNPNLKIPDKFVEIVDVDGCKYRVEQKKENERRVFLCPECQKMFIRPSDLLRHRRIHTNQRPYPCDKCNVKFRTKGALKIHQKVHERVEKPTMNITERQRRQLNEIENQLKTTDAIDIEELSEETLYFVDSTNGLQQFIDVNGVICVLTSDQNIIAPKLIHLFDGGSKNIEFIQEVIVENNDESFIQESVKESITERGQEDHNITNEIDRNWKPVFSNVNEPYINNLAPLEDRTNQESDSDNEVSPLKNEKKNLTCQYCTKFTFKKSIDLIRHIRTHTGDKPFKCSNCPKAFALKCTLMTHQKIHLENRDTFNCGICGRRFLSKNNLEVHRRLHTNVLPFKCNYCDRKFRTSGNTRKHERIHQKLAKKFGLNPEDVHPRPYRLSNLLQELDKEIAFDSVVKKPKSNKLFKCTHEPCSKEFSKPSLLKRHELIHTHIKNFECDICHSRFNQKSALGIHMISHSDIKRYCCDKCGDKFKYNSGLVLHRVTCTLTNN